MALTKPLLYQQVAFDSTQDNTFLFSSQGGSQVTQNQLTIRNNATNAIVYQQTQTTFQFQHIVPANTLVNGTYYSATLVTYDALGNASPVSNTIQFYCYSQPVIAFTNIPVSGIIANASYNFTLQYAQAQGELLNSYVVNLYNSAQSQISTSGTQYVTSSAVPPTDVDYTFSGFEDNLTYYVECNAVTVNGTQITTGKVQFSVSYTSPVAFTVMELTNNCSGGYIVIQSNLALIEGLSNPSPPIYIENKEIDLTASGSWVKWTAGYQISGDFTAKIWARDITPNSIILIFTNEANQTITLRYMVDSDDNTKVYVDLTVDGGYYIYSPSIVAPPTTETVCIQIRRINNIYELKFENIGVVI